MLKNPRPNADDNAAPLLCGESAVDDNRLGGGGLGRGKARHDQVGIFQTWHGFERCRLSA